jgi:hypothetical protein
MLLTLVDRERHVTSNARRDTDGKMMREVSRALDPPTNV